MNLWVIIYKIGLPKSRSNWCLAKPIYRDLGLAKKDFKGLQSQRPVIYKYKLCKLEEVKNAKS